MLPDVLNAPATHRASILMMHTKSDVRLRRLDQVREAWGQEVKVWKLSGTASGPGDCYTYTSEPQPCRIQRPHDRNCARPAAAELI